MNYRLYVYFSVFDIEESESCAADSLSIYDGNSSHAPLIDTICGSKSGNRYMTTGNSLFVQFKSNKNVTKQGFRAYFQQQLICKYPRFNNVIRQFTFILVLLFAIHILTSYMVDDLFCKM